MSLAKNLVRARKKAGLSQAELAKRLKKSRASINEWEAGNHAPRTALLPALARVLGCEVAELLA